jgi:hypothetical protein
MTVDVLTEINIDRPVDAVPSERLVMRTASQVARMRLLRALCSTSASPRASSTGGT